MIFISSHKSANAFGFAIICTCLAVSLSNDIPIELPNDETVDSSSSSHSSSAAEILPDLHKSPESMLMTETMLLGKLFDDSIYYKINWVNSQMDELKYLAEFDLANGGGSLGENLKKNANAQHIVSNGNVLYITSSDNEKYKCVMPDDASQTASGDGSSGGVFDGISPYQLLKPLFSREICSYRLESYWTYELCHGKFLRQFHEESSIQKISTQEFYLGKYDVKRLSATESEFEEKMKDFKKGKRRRPSIPIEGMQVPYIEINMTDGTLCDLSSKPRFTRVFYVCSEDSKHELYSIKETLTCEYEAIVLSPLLCLHSDMKTTTVHENSINCYSVENAPVKPKRLESFEASATKEKNGASIFDGKTIIIGSSDFSKDLNVKIGLDEEEEEIHEVPADPSYDSKLLKTFLSGELCLHGGTGWWKYEFCYGDKVQQYHEDKGTKRMIISLGKWNKEDHLKWLEKNPLKKPKSGKTPKQVSHFYGNGDVCDVTGKPRQVEVKLKCHYVEGHPDSVALYLLEPKACDYVLGIESPLICDLLSTVDENGLMYEPQE